jgi:serine/threonine-protein kinase
VAVDMNTNSDSLALQAALQQAFGPCRVIGEIGRGGMAAVFLAVFWNSDGTARPAVLKQLHPNLALDRDFRAMFEDEARLAMRLHHGNVVETYDVYSDAERCVLVMEFLEGQPLSRIRQTAHRMGNLPSSIHLHCLAQVLAGLDYVHELADERGIPLRIVHRDVTPSNVFVTYQGGVKVVDFGIAKATTRLVETRVGVLKGKVVYMSPEVVRGEPVDRRSDIFSVGVMLWEALTGRRLWQEHDDLAVLRQLANGLVPLRPAGVVISDPAAFAIAERALAPDPDRRYATAAEMRRDLENLLARQGPAASSSALSGYMQICFAEERQHLQSLIHDALQKTRQPSPSRPSVSGDATEAPALEASEAPTTVSIPPAPLFRTITVPGLRREATRTIVPWQGWALATGAVALAASVAFVAHAPPTARAATSVLSASSAPVTAVASVAPPPPAPIVVARSTADLPIDTEVEVAPASATLVFSARPAEARFFLDGERLEGNPVTLQRQPDKKLHRLRIEAPGFVPFSRSFELDEDATRSFDLVRKPPPPARVAHPPETAPPAKTGCPKSRQKQEADFSEPPR